MTRVEATPSEIVVYYKGKEALRLENTTGTTGEFSPGGYWAYHLLGQGERYLRVIRKRNLRKEFGRDKDYDSLDLATYPFRVEIVKEAGSERLGVIQLGERVYVAYTEFPKLLEAPESFTRRIPLHQTLVLSQKRLRGWKGTPGEIWSAIMRRGVEEFLGEVVAFGEMFDSPEEEE